MQNDNNNNDDNDNEKRGGELKKLASKFRSYFSIL